MWIATDFGFFSIVQKDWDKDGDTLTVRARVRGDLVNLVTQARVPSTPIVEDQEADYRYRVQLPAAVVAMFLASAIEDIDYDNFKTRVNLAQGGKRASLYGRVWGVLLDLDRLNTVPRGMTDHEAYLKGFAAEPRD